MLLAHRDHRGLFPRRNSISFQKYKFDGEGKTYAFRYIIYFNITHQNLKIIQEYVI